MSGFPTNQYFFIKSCGNDCVLDVYMGETTINSNIITWPKKPYGDQENQLWRCENGFLLNKKSGLVLDVRGGDLQSDKPIVQYTRKITMAHNQRFGFRDGYIYCLADPRLVLDVKKGSKKDGAKVILYKRKDADHSNQQWVIEIADIGYEMPDDSNKEVPIPYYPPPQSSQENYANIPYYPPPRAPYEDYGNIPFYPPPRAENYEDI
ncbi:ricin B lectin domain-containing protein [Pilobolus umbonatus]|nr:ricin B lectin domain-containing protein [Pilobolus umbonatus]